MPHSGDRSAHQRRVDEFHQLANLKWRATPPASLSDISLGERVLRARLILEEALETIEDGLGLRVGASMMTVSGQLGIPIIFNDLEFYESRPLDIIKTIDGCSDLKVVTTGTLSQFGIDDSPFQFLVDQNNLEKTDPMKGAYIDTHGKLIKPKDHKPPDIEGLFKRLYPEVIL